jgi:hypothetical protein
MKSVAYFFVFVSIFTKVFSQPFYQTLSIPVSKNNVELKNPWAGGMDAPQFSPVDLDNDGKKDLFVFDRGGNKAYTFLNKGNGNYDYAPKYEAILPDMENWALMRDFNKDGVPDIFTWANAGIKVYRGKRNNGVLSFDFITAKYDSSGNLISDLLTFNNNGFNVNVYVLTDDVPGLVDVNGDGDLDVLAFGNFATSVEYYENQSVERGFGADSLIFDADFLDLCWGKFFEGALTNTIALAQCKMGGMEGSDAGRHAGSTICAFDKDGDKDMDLLLGDIAYNTMIYLKNGGDSADANMISYDTIFPAYNIPINMPVFPAAYLIDADNDGANDLLISPNARGSYRNVKNVMWYKNVGSNTNYDFRYQTDSFLVSEILDFGTNSKVAVFDYNGDGLLDIFVGNDTYYTQQFQTSKSQVALLENIGTANAPVFKLVTIDYANIGNFLLRQLQPTFGDLDGDGKKDLLLGDASGYLHFFKNTASTVANFSAMTTPQYFNIDASVNAAPFIYDVDGDGDNDLIVGRRDGTINWYVNSGTANTPNFNKDSVVLEFGKVRLQGQYEIEGASQPIIFKQNDSLFLYTGSNRGAVFKYYVAPNQLRGGTFALLDSNFLGKDVGQKATIAMADFNGDGKPDFVVGNSLGGLNFFSSVQVDLNAIEENLQTEFSWSLFPNPTQNQVIIATQSAEISVVEMYSSVGEMVSKATFSGNISISTEKFSSGIYFVKMLQNGNSTTKRLVVQH